MNNLFPAPLLSLSTFMFLTGALVLLAFLCRFIPSLPEPKWPVKTPFGRLLFFDGVVLYGSIILALLGMLGWCL